MSRNAVLALTVRARVRQLPEALQDEIDHRVFDGAWWARMTC